MGHGWAFFILMAVYLFLWLPSIYGKGAGFPFLCDSWWRSVGGQCAGDTVLAEHMFTEHLLGAGRTGLGPGRRAGQRELRGPGGGPSGALTAAQSPPRASCGPRLRRPSGEGRGPRRGPGAEAAAFASWSGRHRGTHRRLVLEARRPDLAVGERLLRGACPASGVPGIPWLELLRSRPCPWSHVLPSLSPASSSSHEDTGHGLGVHQSQRDLIRGP